ncbi:uncharacterized protein F5891DRAFT_1187514 [Suillus fuscotomentosus]|uniref:Uncharacterized protein n=1 Tax=Suillus fuscotomentosus TaxID=1912939 RepID=A0AAD4HNE6_9AGAM|nr:uncharacterized protein F5891DRAFT_1190589 [Suillus fuscotomentosus]XP_041227209.1 uncharacterized protein F5891DRAFT_1187514 [Suillus fuscotomentosus]KAG1898799.1 hypothetical protein F5891DRAFT_1190589 [Suillus fuscotomentosus]KAG1901634.1 hypothetical protein F5891DRAFT_1187514 [Suillus fuscotomentosus]
MPSEHNSQQQRKTKAKVPKPPRGSGLNPSGELATDQLYIPTEQPQMSSFDFDAHAAPGGWQGSNNDSALPTPMPSSSSLHSWSMQGANTDSHLSYGHSYDTSSLEHASTDFDDDHPPYNSNPQFYDTASMEAPSQGAYPPQGSSQGTAASTSATDATPIQQGEIPCMDVMHTAGPAREPKQRGQQRAMPPTPHLIPYPATHPQGASESAPTASASASASTSQPMSSTSDLIQLTDNIIGQTMKMATRLVTRELFEEQAMAINKAAKKIMLNRVIRDSIPRCFGPNTTFQEFITNKHRKEVANALSSTCGKLIEFARDGVFHAYRLFPPRYSNAPAVIFRKYMIKKIMRDADRLVFMHIYTFDQNGRVEIKAKFQNFFIMANVICFTWSHLRHEFLGETEEEQLKCLKVIWALAGAATFCGLDEQFEDELKVESFGGMVVNRKFLSILAAINNLTGDERVEFNDFLWYVLVVGASQVGS